MQDRIKALRKELGLTQEEFAAKLGIKRGALANYEVGRNEPIDAVVRLICTTFGVDEIWLTTGVGEMFRPMSRNEKLASFFGDVLADKPEAFRVRLCAALADLDEHEWEVAEKFFKNLLGQ